MDTALVNLREILASLPGFEEEVNSLANSSAISEERARTILLNRKTHEYLLNFGDQDHYEGVALGSRLIQES